MYHGCHEWMRSSSSLNTKQEKRKKRRCGIGSGVSVEGDEDESNVGRRSWAGCYWTNDEVVEKGGAHVTEEMWRHEVLTNRRMSVTQDSYCTSYRTASVDILVIKDLLWKCDWRKA